MMGKYALLFVLTLCVYQDTEAIYFRQHHERISIDDVIEKLTSIMQKIQDAIRNMTELIYKELAGLQVKIKDIISQIDVAKISKKIQAELDKVLEGAGIDASEARVCLDSAKSSITNLAQAAIDDATVCISATDDATRNIKDVILDMKDKGESLIEDVKKRIITCIKEYDMQGIITCLEDQVQPIVTEVDEFVTEANNEISSATDMIQNATTNLNECIGKVETDIESQEQTIIYNFEQCINGLEKTRSSIPEIVQKIKDILQELLEVIRKVEYEVKPYINQLNKNVNEFMSKINFEEILANIQKEIQEYLKQHNIDIDVAKQCIDEARTPVNLLVAESKESLSNCASDAKTIIDYLRQQVITIENEGLKVFNGINMKIVSCVQDHSSDLPAAIACLENLVEPSKVSADKTKNDIESFIAKGQKIVNDETGTFNTCISDVQNYFEVKKSDIYKDFGTCVSNLKPSKTI